MSRFRPLVRVLAINTAFAFLPPILLLAISYDRVSMIRLRETFLFSLVYSHCIGGLCFATVPKLWCVVEGARGALQWGFRAAVILCNTVIGSLLACLIMILL